MHDCIIILIQSNAEKLLSDVYGDAIEVAFSEVSSASKMLI